MIENCKTKPMKTGQGILATRVKSATLRVVPIPNMMIWIKGMIRMTRSNPNHFMNAHG